MKKSTKNKIPVYEVSVPEYIVEKEPNWDEVGKKVDKLIKEKFLGQKIVIRGISSEEHDKSMEDLINIIKEKGYDRYKPNMKGDRYENVEGKKIDMFALDFKISKNGYYIKRLLEPFYTFPKKFGKDPIRLDILMIYERSRLRRVLHQYEGRNDIKKDGFVFKDKNNKPDALLGIIKLLR